MGLLTWWVIRTAGRAIGREIEVCIPVALAAGREPMKAQELSPCPEETGVVKSAIRRLEILEYFDEVQQPLNNVAVATALDYPQSSTAALLRSPTTMGYLHYNSRKRAYVPTDRVPFLGSWINPALFEEAGLRSVFRSLHRPVPRRRPAASWS
jgi:IclR helix-turn-helix domain